MEHIVIIDGIEYDTRNVSDLQYLESIGYFDKNKKEDKVESKTTININKKEGWNCPMNTEYIKDKNMSLKNNVNWFLENHTNHPTKIHMNSS